MSTLMSPNQSPGGFRSATRRLNKIPAIIIAFVVLMFCGVALYGILKRGDLNTAIQEDKTEVGGGKDLLENITKAYPNGTMALSTPPLPQDSQSEAVPVASVSAVDLDHPPLPLGSLQSPTPKDEQLDHIKQFKAQQFEQAITSASSGTVSGLKAGGVLPGGTEVKTPSASTVALDKANRWHLDSRTEEPETQYVLRTGSVIPALMISGINSQLPGPVIAQVSQDVYDTPRGRFLLIPQGTRLFGAYSNEVVAGQERVFVAWQRLILPDGKAFDMGEMPATDGAGLAGETGDVNNHYARIFGHALLMSLISAGASYSQQAAGLGGSSNGYGYQPSASGALSLALGQQLGSAGIAVLQKNLNIAPTIEVHAGYRLNVVPVKDMTFDRPYRAFSK